MRPLKPISFSILLFFIISCRPGYQKEDGNWAWVSYDEAAGKRISKIDSADDESFRILPDKEYAKDKNNVYVTGNLILDADPNTFETIAHGYSKDSRNVFWTMKR